MEKKTLDLLSDAISETGEWQWWTSTNDMFQLEFADVLLYDETKDVKQSHTSTIALRFCGNPFAVFLDNLKQAHETKWYDLFYQDDIPYYSVETFEFRFDEPDYAKEVFDSYTNKTGMMRFEDFYTVYSTEHILAAKCGDVGFIVGGDEIRVVGAKGEYTEEEILQANQKWWAYWRDYWRKRGTKEAYEKDRICEATIPADPKHPRGNWYEEEPEK